VAATDQHEHEHDHDHDEQPRRLSRRERERRERAEARRLVALGQIRRYPDPVLRERARDVDHFDEDLAALVRRMGRIMEDAHGVGLAATQLGLLRRVLVYRAGDDDDVVALVNPRIVERGEEREVGDEGCLSLPSVNVPVERDVRLVVEAVDETGAPLRREAEGLEARVIQHEIDHLDGVLILERTTPEARREAMRELRPEPGAAAAR
jgi:peptide deformylase